MTERLVLRPFLGTDAGALEALANDAGIARNLARMPHPYGPADAAEFLAFAMLQEEGCGFFAITARQTGELMGAIGWGHSEAEPDTDLGYWLGRQFWGRGFMGEAVPVVLEHVFTRAGRPLVVTGCRFGNEASRRIILRQGFRVTGDRHVPSRGNSGPMHIETFRLTREEWLASPTRNVQELWP